MCGRFTVLTREELSDAVAAVESRMASRRKALDARLRSDEPRANAYPGSAIQAFGLPSAVASGSEPCVGSSLAIASFTWGIPSSQQNKLVYNTRIESALAGSGMWREPFQQGRCIVPAATFFEPHATETVRNERTGRISKRPYEFASCDGRPLLLAGVCGNGRCSIVTTEPNEWVAPVHARMPLALSLEEAPRWLEGGFESLADLADRSGFAFDVRALGTLADAPSEQLALDLF